MAATTIIVGVTAALADYPATVLSNNPAAYYRLEELPGATVAADSSPNAFDAQYISNLAGTSPQLGQPGLTTNSIGLNGGPAADKGYVLIPYHLELNPLMPNGTNGAAFSVECWVQPNSQPADYCVPLAMFGAYSTPPYNNASGWNIYQTPGPNSSWIFNLKTVGFFNDPTPITLLKWYHLVFTFDGAAGYFYVNGVEVSSAGGIANYLANPSYDGQVGAGDNVGFLPFSGNVDDIAFYTNALSASQVQAHYQVGTNSIRTPPSPPVFVTQPASRTNYHGTTATFTSLAGGTAPITYQWYRGTAPIANATNASYSLSASYPADDGVTFKVVASNVVNVTTSDVVTLTVSTNLNINNQPYGPITRNVGSKAAFRVVADGALPITYQWLKVAGGATNPIAGATSDTLWLSNVQLADSLSEYFAHVTGPFTSADSAAAQLTVQARPVNVPVTGYAKVVVADGPVAYWRLDETDGSVPATDAVGSFDGAYVPGAGTFTFGVAGGIPNNNDPALRVTAGATVQIPYALELNPVTGPWSFEAWVSPAIQPGDFATPFSSMFVQPGSIKGWNIYQHAASAWTMNMFNGGTGGSFNSDFFDIPLNIGGWYHMIISDDLTTIRFFVNGVQRASTPRSSYVANGINGDPATGGNTVLGHRGDAAFLPFDGSFDEVAIYNYALSAQQAQLHYRNTAVINIAKSGNNLVLTWPFGALQAAGAVTGTYTNVPGATSPYTNTTSSAQLYYRVQLQP